MLLETLVSGAEMSDVVVSVWPWYIKVDEEKQRNMPVLMAMFDRETCSLPKTQLVFTDVFVSNMINALNR